VAIAIFVHLRKHLQKTHTPHEGTSSEHHPDSPER